ncbi:MAG: heat-inducible transcriptional repressor HrcA [Candidatus Kapabacteria bacterium]|nr:heat-inducible transcriptional repressor HrcA [Candidatus Kapabacteria bacterium]
MLRELNQREIDILRTIIHLYILNATPVGSRSLSKYLEGDYKLSPATIRNVMADLEEMELISHPHTSAGRVPTDKGYRFYVDSLMKREVLSQKEIEALRNSLNPNISEDILKDASKLLGMLSKYLSIVELPHITDLIVFKIELIYITSNRLLVVIALDSNIVRTVTLEVNFEVNEKNLDELSRFINEKISGKPLKYIRDNFKDIISDFNQVDAPLIRLFIDSIDKLFKNPYQSDRIHISGTQNLLKHPEFGDLEKVRSVIELIENEDIIIHIFDTYDTSDKSPQILIGKEIKNELFEDYSLIISNYKYGSATGSIGLIGPKRMNYSKITSLVQYVTDIISELSEKQ